VTTTTIIIIIIIILYASRPINIPGFEAFDFCSISRPHDIITRGWAGVATEKRSSSTGYARAIGDDCQSDRCPSIERPCGEFVAPDEQTKENAVHTAGQWREGRPAEKRDRFVVA